MNNQKIKRKFNGAKIQEMRINAGMTLADVARELNCDESLVSMWETGNRNPSPRSLKRIGVFFKVAVSSLFVCMVLLITSSAYADVNRAQAIRAIVGEAANQGLDGMTAVGEVIRTRGSVRGLYGLEAMATRKETPGVWDMAARAWNRSTHTNLTHHATMFENIYAFGFPKSWDRDKVVCVAQIKDHWFFANVDSL